MAIRKSIVDRREVYLPTPERWDFAKLDDSEVQRRLSAAEATQLKLESWTSSLDREIEALQEALWERLPVAKMYEVTEAKKRIDEVGRDQKQIARMLTQVSKAIEYIEDHADKWGME